MLGRMRDAIRTLFANPAHGEVRALIEQLQQEREQGRKAVREMVGEMEDVLEKFSRVVARQAKRRTRAMKAALEDEPEEVEIEQPPHLSAPAASKEELRAKAARAGLLTLNRKVQ